jgi:hypothetical protein
VRVAAGIAAIGAVALAPAGAAAATVTHEAGSSAIAYRGGPGEANAVTVTSVAGALVVTETGSAPLGEVGDCSVLSTRGVSCPSAGVTRIDLAGGDMDDQLTNATAMPAQLSGEAGADVLRGGAGADVLDGGDGADTLLGGAGDDTIAPGPGTPLADADSISGGDGIDSVSYWPRMLPVALSKNGLADDGAEGEHDDIGLDVERLTGGAAGDRLTGSALPEALDGGPGDDDLDGGPGDDELTGGAGRDVASYATAWPVAVDLAEGTGGNAARGDRDHLTQIEDVAAGALADTVTGTGDRNVLAGGAGADYVDGRRGVDRLDGGGGADVVAARDATRDEHVSCGPGVDLAIVDRHDPVVRRGTGRCEQIDDGRQRQPMPGRVYVQPRRCGGGRVVQLGLAAMDRPVPLRYAIGLRTGYGRRAAPWLDPGGCRVRVTATPGRGRRASADLSGDGVNVAQTTGSRVTTILRMRRPACAAGAQRRSRPARRRVRVHTRRRPGRWEVRGSQVIAGAVGTDWSVVQTCSRTDVIVHSGRVRVVDRVRHRTVVVRRRYSVRSGG